ncbi:MAG: hypothetical protein WBN38_01115 [Polyangiales bacterium]
MRAGQQLELFSAAFGLAASAALHIAAFAYIASATAHFDFDFALTLPAEVEFGVADGMEFAAAPSQARTEAGGAIDDRPKAEPTDAVIIDGGVPDTDTDADEDTDADADIDAETGAGTDAVSAPALEGPSRLPPGAQLALRIDMKRVRESPLGPDVAQFLQGVPDWQLILDGSGIDPVADLDRLLVATPNLQRSKLVLAGKHHHDPKFVRTSVKRLARTRGKSVRWKPRYGVPTAPWLNRDQTERTIALLSAQHFSITRRQDLQRVLALAKARELRDAEEEGLVAAQGADALLSMGPGEALALEIEGVHRFVLGSIKNVPVRLRVAVRETGSDQATVSVLATYATPVEAAEAASYWKKVATFYSKQLVLSLAGFGKTLRRMDFQNDGERVRVAFTLNADQIRFILSYAEGRLRGSGGATRPRQPRQEW